MNRQRDHRRELAFLRSALQSSPVTHPHPEAWLSGVFARLDERGRTIEPRELDVYVRELAEEALDLGGWAVLPAQDEAAGVLLPTFRQVAALGAGAHALLTQIGGLL